ncbi:cation-translocating P-type ATPase [Desulfatitalea alkaliphila]|uniref:Cation-transporting P-type ATPase n=1 Tax=Desulfatitalea alkaliphila TaxID=2929485 RepID=A0AA41UHV2_9BACT|nr:cation-transporting P-type ATPase [Desulfatitalea alkaliphila]MCJ8499002.1 cation-transporting P-type ATPase [Desulfatitalea alkaliphila]
MNNEQRFRNDYHARAVASVAEALSVDIDQGLTSGQVTQARDQYGRNQLRAAKRRGAAQILLDQFKSVVIIVLVIAGATAFTFRHWAEGIAIAAVLLVNGAIGFFTEFKAVRSMEALKALGGDTIRVRRSGDTLEIDAAELVPGDMVILEGGDLVPADIRLIEANNLSVNESALTGESVAVQKQTEPVSADAPLAERLCMLFKGTTITDGSGEGIVTAVGMQTELGRIADLTESAEKEATPLQQRLDRLGRRLAVLTLFTAAIIAGIGLLAGRDPRQMIETAIALGVAAIPEGLPIVATIALARGMHLMARRNAVIKKLPAVETLGATRVIFTDKTGTLTENRMTLQRVVTPEGDFTLDGPDPKSSADRESPDTDRWNHPLLRRALEVGVLCNNAAIRDADEDNEPEEEQGDPTEAALLRAGFKLGMQRETLLKEKPERREEPFDADRMMMATFHQGGSGMEVAVKGAPGRVLNVCDTVATVNADALDAAPLKEAQRREWAQRAEQLAGEGLRMLAVADKMAADEKEQPYEHLRFLGLVGLLDPAREDVRATIEECRTAGIRVIMVTGDQPATAAAIAVETGLVTEDAPHVVHGNDLASPDRLTDAQRKEVLDTNIFARVSPAQKLHLIQLMQSAGETVAMTGDGVNDAPALKKADIGVAMGRRGTDAARQVADMVLQDDAFATIVAAVRYGRIIFGNIRKSVMFMLCTNVAEVIAVVAAAVAGGFSRLPIPLLPLQILYLNVLTDVFPALALGMGAGDPDVMQRDPRPREEPVLKREHWLAVGGWALLMAACVLGALSLAVYLLEFETRRAVTVSFLTLAFGKLWFVFNLRTAGSRLFDNDIVKNPFIAASLALCAALLLAAVYLPGLSGVLKTEGVGKSGWLLALGMSLVPFLWGQIRRGFQTTHTK